MEKLRFISDAVALNKQCLDFACYLGNLTRSKVTGVFLENQELELRSGESLREIAVCAPVPGTPLDVQKQLYRDENISLFKNICTTGGVTYEIHTNTGMPAAEVIKESRYADLLVMDATTSFSWKPENIPTAFAREVLEKSECPVVIAPTEFDGIDEIVFAYNGSKSSMFAIKQFAHLFPLLRQKKVTVLGITEAARPVKGYNDLFDEWLHIHYDQVEMMMIEDDNVRGALMEYLFGREKVFIVMGAYGRGLLSTIILPNPAAPIIDLINQPVFIAHY